MVKKILTLSVFAVFTFSGCTQTIFNNESEVEAPKVQKKKTKELMSEDERKIMYKGDYNIQYKEPRIVWFKPMLTPKGNVISERTIALAPKDLRWAQEEKTNVGEKFIELSKDK